MPVVNEAVRKAVRAAMKAQGITHEQMAERIGVHRVHVSRMLTGAVGEMSEPWKDMLKEVGLDVTAVPAEKGGEA